MLLATPLLINERQNKSVLFFRVDMQSPISSTYYKIKVQRCDHMFEELFIPGYIARDSSLVMSLNATPDGTHKSGSTYPIKQSSDKSNQIYKRVLVYRVYMYMHVLAYSIGCVWYAMDHRILHWARNGVPCPTVTTRDCFTNTALVIAFGKLVVFA